MRTLAEIMMIVVWCLAVYVCAFDWEDVRDRKKDGNRFPETDE